ncbi:hypothetical protein EVAR_75407_1 [Eumeta japonica]|uniref:Uncharacterized protein n=1 Tax=Eumeta variegata TaxID=151549 RepID=A0A4C1TL42_EUMVA|nr:hypothetical protein EVAR_75407_1 [Eumeta japonica]
MKSESKPYSDPISIYIEISVRERVGVGVQVGINIGAQVEVVVKGKSSQKRTGGSSVCLGLPSTFITKDEKRWTDVEYKERSAGCGRVLDAPPFLPMGARGARAGMSCWAAAARRGRARRLPAQIEIFTLADTFIYYIRKKAPVSGKNSESRTLISLLSHSGIDLAVSCRTRVGWRPGSDPRRDVVRRTSGDAPTHT